MRNSIMTNIDMKQAAGCLLAGAMVGAAIALLYAPQSGVRTRKDIRKFAGNTVDRLDELQGVIRDQAAEWVDDISEVVRDGVERGKKLRAESYEKVLQGFDSARQCVEDGRSRIELLIRTSTKESA
jgi:gas vesicle protein